MDYYQTLGVSESASQDEIKKAYKKLAMKNHPDRGGDTKKFQEISQAYDTLSDTNKRAEYDAQKNGFSPFANAGGFGGGFRDINDIFKFHFGQGFSGFSGHGHSRRNKDLTIRVSITLKQSYTGTQLEARYNTPTGKSQTVAVDIPAGVSNGQTIRYPDLGDDSIPGLPRGNLNVQVIVEPDPEYERRGNDLWTYMNLTVLEAMTGCMKGVKCLDGTTLYLSVRPGTEHGTDFCASGKGFRDLNSGQPGNFFITTRVSMPAVTDPQLISELQSLYSKIQKK